MKRRTPWAVAASATMLVLAGCALAGNPQPPTLWLPEPVRDLTAVRVGNEVHLHWTMPRNSTDKLALKGEQRAHFCWMPGAAAESPRKEPAKPLPSSGLPECHSAGDAVFAPDKPADFTAAFPAELITGSPAAASYFVELRNRYGKTAGPSNPAVVATGSAPSAVEGLTASTQADGVVLHWQKANPEPGLVMRIQRALAPTPGAPRPNEATGVSPLQRQVLEVDLEKDDPGQALDADAEFDHVWQYTVERVRHSTIDSRTFEAEGMPSQPVTINAKDVFPPAVPTGLAAVADEQVHTIDISWTPDSDRDLAGYIVYRRDEEGGVPAERISGTVILVSPEFEDKSIIAGHRYAYAVSAVDHDGNESARSAEVEEELPQEANPPQ